MAEPDAREYVREGRSLKWIPWAALPLIGLHHVFAWSSYPVDIDPINFVCALRGYDVNADAPHAPGYLLLVGSARLASFLVGDYFAYQLVSLLMLGTSGVLLYRVARTYVTKEAALTGAALFMTHPLVMAASVVPRSYVSDAFGATLLVASALLAPARGPRAALTVAATFTVIAFIRPFTCVLLGPLGFISAFVAYSRGNDFRRSFLWAALACAIGIAGTTVAYLFTAQMAGGLEAYRALTERQMGVPFREASIFGGAPFSAHASMVLKLYGWLAIVAAPIALFGIAGLVLRRRMRLGWQPVAVTCAWVAGPLVFYTGIYYCKPTYHIIYLPALMACAAWLLFDCVLQSRRALAVGIVIFLLVGQVAFYWIPIPVLPAPIHRLTNDFFRSRELAWSELQQALPETAFDTTLPVYVHHDRIHPLSLRLLSDDRVFAVVVAKGEAHYYGHFWLSEEGEKMYAELPEEYDSIFSIDDRVVPSAFAFIPIPAEGPRQLGDLLP